MLLKNLSPLQIRFTDVVTIVRDVLFQTGLPSSRLELEVTETGIQSTPDARSVLERLKQIGVGVAIDDFGTGYSSLGSLKHLPVDCLKI